MQINTMTLFLGYGGKELCVLNAIPALSAKTFIITTLAYIGISKFNSGFHLFRVS